MRWAWALSFCTVSLRPTGSGHRPRVALEAGVLAAQLVGFERAFERQQQLGHRQRLLDEVQAPRARGLDRGLDRAVAGHHDHRAGQAVALGSPFLEQADAVDVRHPDVEQDQVRAAHGGLAGGGAVFRGRDLVVLASRIS